MSSPEARAAGDMGDPRTVEQLLDATDAAPTFGLNARELILQAARLIAQEDGGASAAAAQRAQATKEVLTAIFREGPALLQALPREQRPLVPFRAINRSKVPRVTRQLVLERLTGQHLALALHQAGEPVTPASLAALADGSAAAAVTAAIAQEEELYERGKASKAVYLNYAARCNAGLWGQPDEPEPPPAAADCPAKRPKLAEPQGPSGALLEADIDWDNLPAARPEAATAQAAQPSSAAAAQPAAGRQGEAAGSKAAEQRQQGPQEQGAGRQRQQQQQQQQQQAARPHKQAPSSSIARPALRLQAPAAAVSAAGQEAYSPSRHGGESPPAAAAAEQPAPGAAGAALSPGPAAAGVWEGAGRQSAAQQPPGDPAVAAALAQFLRTHLEPLYQAKVVSRAVYKRALQQTVEKVMASHRSDTDARFLVREGPKVVRLLQQLVEREQAREAGS